MATRKGWPCRFYLQEIFCVRDVLSRIQSCAPSRFHTLARSCVHTFRILAFALSYWSIRLYELPRAGIHLAELSNGWSVRIHAAVNVDDLSRGVGAFIGAKIYGCMSNVFWATVAVNHDATQEDIFEHLRNLRLVFWRNNQAWTDTIAADVVFAVLQGNVLREDVYARLGACISGRT